jgi:hypothetical protein
LEPVAADFGEPGVDEEVDACAGQCGFGVAGGGEEVRWVCVGQEGGDDAGFGDDFAVEVDGWDEAALVSLLGRYTVLRLIY